MPEFEDIKYVGRGGLNYDDKLEVVPPSDYRYALNCIQDEAGEYGLITNIKGNQLVTVTWGYKGVNTVIGYCEDKELRALIWFVYNNRNHHSIIRYKIEQNLVEFILHDEPILNFNLGHRINNAGIVGSGYRKMLFWTDDFNPPRKLNIAMAKGFTVCSSTSTTSTSTTSTTSTSTTSTTSTSSTTTASLFSAEYQLVWDEFVNKPSDADALIQDAMLSALVSGGYYAKAELLDVFSAHSNTAGESQKNWKNPGTFDPTLVNSPTWTQYAGFTGAVIGTKYVRLNFNPAGNGTLIGQDNICVIIGVGNDVAEGLYDFGGKDGATGDWLTILARSAVDRFYTKCNDTATGTYIANTSSIGHFAASRGTALNYDMHKNLTKTNKTVTSTGTVNIELHACGYNNNGVAAPCTKQLRYVFILSYLTDAEVKAVIAIMETYLDNYGTGLY